jgi:hypothetical protein
MFGGSAARPPDGRCPILSFVEKRHRTRTDQVSVATFLSRITWYWVVVDVAPWSVTPAPDTVIGPVPACFNSSTVPTGKGTLALVGKATVTAAALVKRRQLP